MAKDKEAVKITFKFAPNPFFKNKTLEREDGIEVLCTSVIVYIALSLVSCVCVYFSLYTYVDLISLSLSLVCVFV